MRKYFGLIAAVAVTTLLISRWEVKLPQAPAPSPQLKIAFTGWQDVVNEKYGYSFKMPHDWNKLQMEGEPAYPQRLKVVNVKPEEQQKPHVGIIITVMPFKNQPLEDYPEIKNFVAGGREPRKLKLAGEPALFLDNLGESGEEFCVFILHKDRVYRFDWTGTHPDVRKQYKDNGLKILASFKFD